MVFIPNKRMVLPIEAEPEIASKIGIIASHAAVLESLMSGLFCDLMGVTKEKGELAFGEIAGRRKREILVKLLESKEPKDIAEALIKLLNNEVKKAAQRRNEIVHQTLAASGNSGMLLLETSLTGPQQIRITPKLLDADIRYHAKTSAAFHWLCLALQHPSLAISPEQRGHPNL